jgi:hypothetical protein
MAYSLFTFMVCDATGDTQFWQSCGGVSGGRLLVPVRDVVKFPREQEPSAVFLIDHFFSGKIEEKPVY